VAPDLTQKDFRVFDNGQEQKIAFFSKDSSEENSTGRSPLPHNTWSNRAGGRGGVPVNLTVVLVDGLNTKLADQGRARQQVLRFLGQIKPEDRVALYFLGDSLRVLHDFTSDPNSLLRTLAKDGMYNGHLISDAEPDAASEESTGDADLDQFITDSDVFIQQYQTTDRVLRTTDAFEAIATHLASLPGRKSLFWISGSFPLMLGSDVTQMNSQFPLADQRLYSDEVQRAARALNDANVAIYPVDARGLLTETRADSQALPRTSRTPPRPQSITPDAARLNTMDSLAQQTGGMAYHDTNDLAGALRKAIEDSSVVYTLAFTPSHNEWNGEFRKLRVETSRPGVQLRHRSGYFAFPDKPVDSTQKDQILAQAQWSIMDATEIGLTFNATRVTVQGNPKISFAVLADSAGIRFSDVEGKKAADLILTLGEKAADGKLVQEETKTLNLRLPEERYRAVIEHGLRLTGSMPLDSAATQFRVVMLDTATGHLGSLEFRLAELTAAAATPGAGGSASGPATAPSPANKP
jgi:VWFA-related protein